MPLVLTDKPFTWDAQFAWSKDRTERGLAVRFFRLDFEFTEIPPTLLIHVTADSRYRLLLNGRLLGRGPAKGALDHYTVESYDLAPKLVSGRNVLAAEVRWFGEDCPMSEVHSAQPGLMVHATEHGGFDTPGNWRVCVDRSVTPDKTAYHDNAHRFLDHMDRVDFRLRDSQDWTLPDFDDSAWERAVPIGLPVNDDTPWGVADLRTLEPRDIPLLPEVPKRFARCSADGRDMPWLLEDSPVSWEIPANAGATMLVDAGEMTTAYPIFAFRGGRGREVRVTYSEAMGTWETTGGRRRWVKRVRDDPNGVPHGYRDTLFLSGRHDVFEPFHWRAFRFINVEVMHGPESCAVVRAHYRRCVFPQTLSAEFESSDSDSRAIMQTSWRTAELCAHETYEDCPYYEQLNYIADSRLQALTSYYLANETRLARRCLRLYRDSVRPQGLIGARVPSRLPQLIPYFCFHWIFMVEDYWLWVGARDKAFVRSCLPVVDGILTFFRERLRDDGFVGEVPHWNIVDRHPGVWTQGEPPAVLAGESTFLTCLFIQALEAAIRLHVQAGRPEDADRWRAWPERLREAVRTHAWDEQRGLILEGPGRTADRCSQHVQCAAVSAEVLRPPELLRLGPKLASDPDLLECHFMPSFYLARALEPASGYARFHSHVLEPWRRMLAQNTTTWWEYPDPTRSDCHGWSSWVAVDFLSTVLGIKPGAPGWTAIRLAPQFDGLDWARGSIATPVGRIEVEWRRHVGRLEFQATTPAGVPVELQFPGEEAEHIPNGGVIIRTTAVIATTG